MKKSKKPVTKKTNKATEPSVVTLAEVGLIERHGRTSKYRETFERVTKLAIGKGLPVPGEKDLDPDVLRQRVAVALGRFAPAKGDGYVLRAVRNDKTVFVGKFAPKAKAKAK
jgi:hypothetical protein